MEDDSDDLQAGSNKRAPPDAVNAGPVMVIAIQSQMSSIYSNLYIYRVRCI